MKLTLKLQAINLRKNGFSYSEILSKIPVAKSTLSLWLRSVGLSKRQKQRLTLKKIKAALKGAKKRKLIRLKLTQKIKKQARKEIKDINFRELWLMGIVLYWAEGSKEKEYKHGQGVVFSNSDPLMITLFLKWLVSCAYIKREEIDFSIYLHENHKNRVEEVKKYWANKTGFPMAKFDRIYYKKHKITTFRKKTGDNYYGLVRVIVKKSSSLNRKISGWIEGICSNCRVV